MTPSAYFKSIEVSFKQLTDSEATFHPNNEEAVVERLKTVDKILFDMHAELSTTGSLKHDVTAVPLAALRAAVEFGHTCGEQGHNVQKTIELAQL